MSKHTSVSNPFAPALYSRSNASSQNYQGLPIHAMPGLHEYVVDKLTHFVPTGRTILDLGAGSGALSLRFLDLGYEVTAADIGEENFRLHGKIPFVKANFDRHYSENIQGNFDCIAAIEVIEHIRNPRLFLREASYLLKTGGVFVLSTPNLCNPVSKALFVRDGTHWWFSDQNYETDGHITPISTWQLRKIYSEVGLTPIYEGTVGDPYKHTKGRPKLRLAAILMQLLSETKSRSWEIYVAVLRNDGKPVLQV